MRVSTSITSLALNRVADETTRLEAAGFDVVTTQENRHDPFLPHAIAATATRKLALRTSIAIAFSRSPMPVANVAWDLQQASAGRFTLGLGSQVRGHNVRRFSVPWSAPAPRMREYVEALRAIFHCWETGERLNYEGKHYQFSLMTPNFTPEPLPCPPPAIQIAAVGPGMLNVAGAVCDGVQLHPFCTARYLRESILPRIEKALAKRRLGRSDFEISGGGFIATGATDEAVRRAFDWVRMRVGFYGSTPSYWPVFEAHGLGDLGRKLNEMSKRGDWDAMTDEVNDDVVHLFCASGRHDEIAVAIAERFGGLTDMITLDADVPAELVTDIQQAVGSS